jgi:mitotic spindle assembly checkpoint protein MAD2B
MDAIRDQLEKNTVERVALCIHEVERNVVLERWSFDLSAFPVVEQLDRDTPFERQVGGRNASGENFRNQINIADVEAQFRAVLSRVTSTSARLKPLPKDRECSFTISIEVRDNADRPVGRLEKEERKWIAAEPEPWSDSEEQHGKPEGDAPEERMMGDRKRRAKIVPIRRLEAGELRMEVWVEESEAKFPPENVASA